MDLREHRWREKREDPRENGRRGRKEGRKHHQLSVMIPSANRYTVFLTGRRNTPPYNVVAAAKTGILPCLFVRAFRKNGFPGARPRAGLASSIPKRTSVSLPGRQPPTCLVLALYVLDTQLLACSRDYWKRDRNANPERIFVLS